MARIFSKLANCIEFMQRLDNLWSRIKFDMIVSVVMDRHAMARNE